MELHFVEWRFIRYRTLISTLLYLLVSAASVLADCSYTDRTGVIRSANSLGEVPILYQTQARCNSRSNSEKRVESIQRGAAQMVLKELERSGYGKGEAQSVEEFAAVKAEVDKVKKDSEIRPDEVKFEGSERKMQVATNLGDVSLRWPRAVEDYFGMPPDRAIRDAWLAASRVLAQNSFPVRLQTARYQWNMVFMDEVPREVDIASGLCHPGWMQPPADIFIAGRRLATGCGSSLLPKGEALQSATETMIHELGHAVEFQLLGRAFGLRERWHSEGFATWFEGVGAKQVAGRGSEENRQKMRMAAKLSLKADWDPRSFIGSIEDYARAYALISAIADGQSVARLVDVYRRMERDTVSMEVAVQRELGWDTKVWVREALKSL